MEDESRIPYFLLGLGLGVAVGVLFAPKAGAETRDMIAARANDSTDYVKRRAVELRDTAAETIDRGKEALRQQKENLSAAVEAGKQAYRSASSNPLPE